MANADPEGEHAEYQNYFDEDINSIDSEEGEDEAVGESDTAGTSKQNGQLPQKTDRYGFLGGEQYTDPERESRLPVSVLRKRELKWLDMLENWEKWMSKRFKKVKDRCRKGIPPSMRARAWQYLCGSKFLLESNRGRFEVKDRCRKGIPSAIRPRAWQYLCGSKFLMEHNRGRFEEYLNDPGDPKWIDDITKDLHRQFPFHEMFVARGGHGQEDLFRVLKAYTVHNPTDGYCQAQAPIAAVLLMHMPAEQAFWCLVSICEKYLPGYYSPGLEAVQIDGDVLFGLLKKTTVPIYKHLKKYRVDPILYMTEWYMCVYARTLPWSSVLRVWDMFFCEGVKVMFRVAITLCRAIMGRPEQLAEAAGLYETMEKLRHIPPEYTHEDYLLPQCNRISISERDMEKEHQYQLAKRRTAKEKANKPDSIKKKKKTKKSPTEDS